MPRSAVLLRCAVTHGFCVHTPGKQPGANDRLTGQLVVEPPNPSATARHSALHSVPQALHACSTLRHDAAVLRSVTLRNMELLGC